MPRSFNIAILAACPFPYERGTPARIFRMAEALSVRGHNVHVVTYHLGNRIADLPFRIHRIPNVPTYHKTSPGPTYQKLLLLDTLLAAKLFSVVRQYGIEIIHAHHYEALLAGLPASRLFGLPLVFDVHTLLSSELPYYPLFLPQNFKKWVGSRLDHTLPPVADHIVAVTETIRDKMIGEIGISPENVTTVYGGIESAHFDHTPDGLPERVERTLIYTGNLAAYQGIDLMLRAFRQVLDHQPDVILKIVSDSSPAAYAQLIDQLQLGERIQFEPSDYFQLPHQLSSALIALNPRVECDGLPLKVLNYMAAGRAIVSFAGSAESLEHNHTGLIVPDNDIQAFARAVLTLLDRPELAYRLGTAAHKTVRDFYVWEQMVELLEGVYAGVLEKRK